MSRSILIFHLLQQTPPVLRDPRLKFGMSLSNTEGVVLLQPCGMCFTGILGEEVERENITFRYILILMDNMYQLVPISFRFQFQLSIGLVCAYDNYIPLVGANPAMLLCCYQQQALLAQWP